MIIFLLYTWCINDFYSLDCLELGLRKTHGFDFAPNHFKMQQKAVWEKPTTNAILPFLAHIFIYINKTWLFNEK